LRAASYALEGGHEEITEAGYIRRISVLDSRKNLDGIIRVLKKRKGVRNLWSLDVTGTVLSVNHSLLKFIDPDKYRLIVQYFLPKIHNNGGDDRTEIVVNSGKSVFVARECKYLLEDLNPYLISKLFKLSLGTRHRIKKDMKTMKDRNKLQFLMPFERIESGLSEIF